MVLVDTSSWIETLRASGSPAVRARVTALVTSGQAVWCDPVRLELWHGARGKEEKRRLEEMDQTLVSLPIDDSVWGLSMNLARRTRSGGVTVPALDLLIAACARHYHVDVETTDQHFQKLLMM